MDCPLCKNADKVYDQGFCPVEGLFILCMTHGIVVIGKKVERIKERMKGISNMPELEGEKE